VRADFDATSGVGSVEFSKPPYNYFDVEMIRGIGDAYATFEEDPRCRAIVLASPGKHFCAGADFSHGRLTAEEARALYEQAARLFSFSVPVVAAVQGRAIGGGLGVALSADFRIADPGTRFVCNFARLGLHHGFGVSVTLPAIVGQQRALQLLFTGGEVSGEDALEWGLCDQLAHGRTVLEEAHEFAQRIAACAPLAVRSMRRTMWSSRMPELVRAATVVEHQEQSQLFETRDFTEGINALAERRTPRFIGK
jgi:enoyl-CoA hydratase/carnithine racemase